MKRENGFYWVRTGSVWDIAEYCDFHWYSIGCGVVYGSDKAFDEVDEKRITR